MASLNKINIAGEKLAEQELRNAVYSGPFVTDAKRHFSKPGCPAQKIASSYMEGSPIRQDYLETALRWIGNGADPRFFGSNGARAKAARCQERFPFSYV